MPCTGLRFLVIEDHPFQRSMLCQMLQTLGAAAVVGTAGAREALRYLEEAEGTPDAVVLDLLMDDMDGMEFMRHLSKLAPGLPVLVSSACDSALLASVAQVAEAYGIRLAGVVQKPLTAAKLAPILANLRAAPVAGPTPASRFSLREIADAWSRDEFQALFEPRVNLTTGAVVCMDVSPAWEHATLGQLTGAQFMPSVEARGLGDEFALLMLERAMARCRKWHQRGMELTVAAELPFECLDDARLVDRIHGLAVKEEANPRWLMLQVAGSPASGFKGMALENLARLRMRGFQLGMAVQDAGTAALDALRCASFSELRMRRSAYSPALRSGTARAGLTRSLQAARECKVRTVGAGLASKEEWALLLASGCEQAQGPFVSQPLGGRAVAGWMSARAATTIR
ncbi:MAG TPA: EAL domain-containing protein [Ramlibacter sp.]|jgi:EAL domain-containing protein (putative c-di-GMP-specific phosphodiesterase class I)